MTVTGWRFREIGRTPFRKIVKLFKYWQSYPPLHVMVRNYLGIEDAKAEPNMIETAQAIKILGGGRAQKLSSAPEADRKRFAELKEIARQKNAG